MLGRKGFWATREPIDLSVPGQVTGYSASIDAIGISHTCVALSVGSVGCAGLNNRGQLDLTGANLSNSFTLEEVFSLYNVVSISPGAFYNCAVTQSGQVYCWGMDSYNQLGMDYILRGSWMGYACMILHV